MTIYWYSTISMIPETLVLLRSKILNWEVIMRLNWTDIETLKSDLYDSIHSLEQIAAAVKASTATWIISDIIIKMKLLIEIFNKGGISTQRINNKYLTLMRR